MTRSASLLLSALILSPIAGFAQQADPYHATFGNYQVGGNISELMDSAKTTSSITENVWGAISEDPKAMCKQVGLGNNTNSSERTSSSNREWNRGSSSSWDNKTSNAGQKGSSSQGGGGANVNVFGVVEVGGNGGGGGSSSNSWNIASSYAGNKGSSNTGKTNTASGTKLASSKVVIGTDCTALIESAASMENNRMNNDTQRLGILVGNETQRYGIDKQHQVAIKQIEAGQIQSVFGGGAKAMMGSMGN
jgi:hypothetical protein